MTNKIAVIMSTYNGSKYLREQINSVLAQENVDLSLIIRDDGSSDNTGDILYEYSNNTHMIIERGRNIGVGASFLTELKKINGFDYYAFCDQDDYWHPSKLSSAIKKIESVKDNNSLPVLYYSNVNIADECLNTIKKTKLENRKNTLESNLMRRSIAGCTMVFNNNLKKKIDLLQLNSNLLCLAHDAVVSTVCYSVGGIVICDENAYIQYRQHGGNTSEGNPTNIHKRIEKEFRFIREHEGNEIKISEQVFSQLSKYLSQHSKTVLTQIIECKRSVKTRIKILLSPSYSTGNYAITVWAKILILFGKI